MEARIFINEETTDEVGDVTLYFFGEEILPDGSHNLFASINIDTYGKIFAHMYNRTSKAITYLEDGLRIFDVFNAASKHIKPENQIDKLLEENK